MGLAEVIPGVSGGTMAFVTGIYTELVSSLASFGPASLPMLARPMAFYRHHNLRFLLSLGLGMMFGALLFARVMHFLLVNFSPLVWAFFTGVIAMSVVVIGRQRARTALWRWAPLGLLAGVSLLLLPVRSAEAGQVEIFLGASIAVCAWLLPAISGSYVLLTLGMYSQVIDAIATLDWPVLLAVVAGCATGILLFAKLLAWLMRRYTEALLSFLTGFMLGSIAKLWPWQDGSQSDALARLLSPAAYTQLFDSSAHVLLAAGLACCGALALWLLSKTGDS